MPFQNHSLPSGTIHRHIYIISSLTTKCMPPKSSRPLLAAGARERGSPLSRSTRVARPASAGRLAQAHAGTVGSVRSTETTAGRPSGRRRRLSHRDPVRPTPPSHRAPPTVSSSLSHRWQDVSRPLESAGTRLGGVGVHSDGVTTPEDLSRSPFQTQDVDLRTSHHHHHRTCPPGCILL